MCQSHMWCIIFRLLPYFDDSLFFAYVCVPILTTVKWRFSKGGNYCTTWFTFIMCFRAVLVTQCLRHMKKINKWQASAKNACNVGPCFFTFSVCRLCLIPHLPGLPVKFNVRHYRQNGMSQIGSWYHKTGTYLLRIKYIGLCKYTTLVECRLSLG